MQHLIEGTTPFATDSEEKISKGMPIFYNPVMKLNRDLSLLALATMRNPRIALPMEASGIRAARILNELGDGWTPSGLHVNDISPTAIEAARRNVAPYLRGRDVAFTTMDANLFLRTHGRFDYIDIDPFGTPNPFLDSAVQALKRGAILAVTATDTSALAGTYPRATQRKYWAMPSRTWVMHEIGMRILIRKVQLVAAQYTVALTPLLSVATDHYYRIFFRAAESANAVKPIVAQHKRVHVDTGALRVTVEDAGETGPLWTGPLHDAAFVKEMLAHAEPAPFSDARQLLRIIEDECRIPVLGFLDLHDVASALAITPPRRERVLERLGERACRTHLCGHGIKTDLTLEEVRERL